MSQVENTLALSLLLRRFRPEYVGDDPAGINATVTLRPRVFKFKIRELRAASCRAGTGKAHARS
jgi:hypothetical protein